MTKAAAAKAAEAAAKAAEAAAAALDIIIDEDWEWRLKDLPEFATATGDHRYDDRLDDRSLAAYDQRIKWSKSVLVRVKAWEHQFGSGSGSGSGSDGGSGGDPPQELADARVSARLLAHHARSVCEGGQFGTFLCPINRLEGPHTELPQLIEYMKFETLKDYEKYVSRLKGVPLALAQVTALLKRGVVTGMLPPLVGLEGVADQLASVVAYLAPGKVKESPFWRDAPTSAAVAAAGATLEGEAVAALAAARDSFEALRRHFVDDYEPAVRRLRGPEGTACHDLPRGKDLYACCLAFHTGSRTLTAKTIHETGLSEVARIGREMHAACVACGMDPVADAAGLKLFLADLKVDPRFTSASADEHVAKYRNLCLAIYPQLPKLFSIRCLPRTPFAVVPTPAAQADAAPSAYYLGGAGDGTRPGTFYVNCSSLVDRPFYEAEALALHEAIPGHHTQTMLAAENANLPPFRRFMDDRRYSEAPGRYPIDGAFIEGWGLYSESLGSELGCYKDPFQLVGRLSAEMFRACRLVVDTGIHSMGWSVERAKAFMATHTAASAGNIDAEVKRYCTWPGQATGYKTGELEIKRLRRRFLAAFAKEEAASGGEGCDLRAFHDIVLLQGSLPLYIIEELMEEYIARKLAALRSSSSASSSSSSSSNSSASASSSSSSSSSSSGATASGKDKDASFSSYGDDEEDGDEGDGDWRSFAAGVGVGMALLTLALSKPIRDKTKDALLMLKLTS